MQYTSKLAILAVALFSSSVLGLPFAVDTQLKVREAVNELSAREVFDAYLEARADPSINARDLEYLELEAREYLESLEIRAAATSTEPSTSTPSPTHSGVPQSQTPMSHGHPSNHSSNSTANDYGHYLAKIQEDRAALKTLASQKLEDASFYKEALADKDNQFHKFAVKKYLSDPSNMKEALATKSSAYHKAALRITHKQNAKVYLSQRKNYIRALKSTHNKYHKDAVKQYLSDPESFQLALTGKHAHFHKEAVREYLQDDDVRKSAIADEHSAFHKAAVKMQKKIDHKKHGKHSTSDSTTASHTSATASHTSSSSAPTSTHTA